MDICIKEKDRKSIAKGLSHLLKEFVKLSSIEESDNVPNAQEMIKALVAGHEAVCRTARSVFPAAEAAADEATKDLLTQRLQLHEKTGWMLLSLLEK